MNKQLRSDVLRVVEARRAVYYLTVDYEEAAIGHGDGSLYATSVGRDEGEVPVLALATNEMLSCLWLSPSGALWVASANGKVATTASHPWSPTGSAEGAGYEAGPGSSHWVVTSLPVVRSTGLRPNITALWGIDDDTVFVGTYGGHIYQWDGQSWLQTHEGPGKGNGTLTQFGGPAADHVFAAGQQGTLLQYDGNGWHTVAIPGEPNGRENFTGIQTLDTGDVLISASGTQGRLLHGDSAGLTELGRYDIPLISMALLDDRVVFATGKGCAELVGREVKVIKDTFDTVAVFAGRGRVFFIEPEQPVPGYVEYDPREGKDAWWGMEF